MAQMPAYRSRYGDTITDLLARRGDIAAQGHLQSGAIWGNAVQNVGNIAATAIGDYAQVQQQKEQERQARARDIAIAEVLSSEVANDPQALYKALLQKTDPKTAMAMASGAASLQKLSTAKDPKDAMTALPGVARGFVAAPDSLKPGLWGVVRERVLSAGLATPEDLPEKYDPEVAKGYVEFALGMEKQAATAPKAPERIEQNGQFYERQADGTWAPAVGLPTEVPKAEKSPWAQPFTGPDGLSYQKNEMTGEVRRTPGVGTKAAEPAPELTLNPEGVVLSSYGVKQKEEARRQARERGLPVFENATAQTKGVQLAGIAAEAQELATLLNDPDVAAVIGPALTNPLKAARRAAGGLMDLDPDAQRALQLAGMLSDNELRKRTGAAAGEPEMKRILGFAVKPNMPIGNLKTNLQGMLKAAARDYKALSGVTPPGVLDVSEAGGLPAETKSELDRLFGGQ